MKTDIQLQQDVLDELKWDPKINAANVGVEVKNGVVTLLGHVDNYPEKWAAEDAAKRVSGVKALAVELDVILANSYKRTDSQIAQAAANALKANIYNLGDLVHIKVENGYITLTGSVEWQFQKNAAVSTMRYIAGVRGVYNQILIKPKISVSAVKSDIDAAINRRALSDIHNIKVQVSGTEVILGGKVHDWSEKNLAVDAAWSVPGVSKVTDNMAFV
ncbi:MAG: BON domain-containing protein [Methylococcales bacterium]